MTPPSNYPSLVGSILLLLLPHFIHSQTTTTPGCSYPGDVVVNSTESYTSFRENVATQCLSLVVNTTVEFAGIADIDLSGIESLDGYLVIDDTFEPDDVLSIHSDTLTRLYLDGFMSYGIKVTPREGIFEFNSSIQYNPPLVKGVELSLPKMKDFSGFTSNYVGFRNFTFNVGGDVDGKVDDADKNITANYISITASKATHLDFSPFSSIHGLYLELNRMSPQDDDAADVVSSAGVIAGGQALKNIDILNVKRNENTTAISFPSAETVHYMYIVSNTPSPPIEFPSLKKSGAIVIDNNPNSTASFPELEEIEVELIAFLGIIVPDFEPTTSRISRLAELDISKLRSVKMSNDSFTRNQTQGYQGAALEITDMEEGFQTLDLRSLETVEGTLTISNMSSLTHLNLSSLKYAGGLWVDGLGAGMPKFEVPELKEVSGDLYIYAEDLDEISLPKLEKVGSLLTLRVKKGDGFSCEMWQKNITSEKIQVGSFQCEELERSNAGTAARALAKWNVVWGIGFAIIWIAI